MYNIYPDLPLGLDVSRWQDDNSTPQMVNFDVAKRAGAEFVFIKASQLVVDQDFVMNWHNAKEAGLFRGAYHFLDWRRNEIEQADLFCDLLAGDPGELPPVCDFEMRSYAPPQDVARGRLWNFLARVEKRLDIRPDDLYRPMIYTGYYYWNEFGSPDQAWAKYPLWEAWWRKPANEIKVPKPWKKWHFLQFDDKGDGKAFGCESWGVDVNRWNGTLEELKAFASPLAPIQNCPTCGQPLPKG